MKYVLFVSLCCLLWSLWLDRHGAMVPWWWTAIADLVHAVPVPVPLPVPISVIVVVSFVRISQVALTTLCACRSAVTLGREEA